MAHKQGVGSTKNNRDSNPKNLGIKKHNKNFVLKGQILFRQRNLNKMPGLNVGIGQNFTLYALKNGFVSVIKNKKFNIQEFL